jgi:hypothetical protein
VRQAQPTGISNLSGVSRGSDDLGAPEGIRTPDLCLRRQQPSKRATLWPTRSSSRKNPAKRKTSAPPWVLATETSSRPRVIYSTCSNLRMSCRRERADHQSFSDPKVFTALAWPKAETKPSSSEPFARRYTPPSEFGSPPTVTAKVSSSAGKFSSIMSTAVR